MSARNFRVHEKRQEPYSIILDSRLKDETLLFESGVVAELNAAEVEALKKDSPFSKLCDAYCCLGVLQIDRTFQFLALVTSCVSVGKILDSEIYRITGTTFYSLSGSTSDDDKASGVQKLFNSGTFYFAQSSGPSQFDLTLCSQRRLQDHDTDNRFFWNRSMHIQFERYGISCADWLVKCICGGIEMRTIYSGNKQAKACIISRLSCERAGTRFNTRGVNDDGHVANFVETEQVIFLDNAISSFVQIRGSVPLFWEQPGLNVGSHKIKFSRGYEACAPAFERHIDGLVSHYGNAVLINLMGSKEGERTLSSMFEDHIKASKICRNIAYHHFDYHSECRGGNQSKINVLVQKVKAEFEEFGVFYHDGAKVCQQQSGCFRTNCVDCLDRTNAVQSFFGLIALRKQLESLGLSDKQQMVSRFDNVYTTMWQANGDSLSRIYAGTSAMTVGKSKYRDVTTSATRAIQNNFLDSGKQDSINLLLLGSRRRSTLDDAAYSLNLTNSMLGSTGLIERFVSRHGEYTSEENIRVCLATWNVNGGTHFRSIAFRHESLNDWLLDLYTNSLTSAPETCDISGDPNVDTDIFAIGFEEIVDLTAKNITSASTSNQKTWGAELEKTISRDHKYVLITSSQLVGVCLFVFVRPHLVPFIRDVSVDSVKTGLGGAAGNKGAIAIRFVLCNTSMCFVCAHFAAGQSGVKERNEDFAELSSKISFPMGGSLKTHDYVFWVGDLNYRIDLPKNEAERLIKDGNWTALHAADQLSIQRKEGTVFHGYEEGTPNFAPTYKYDLFCNDYDTSEKARVPSWTDRCLWKRSKLLGTNEMTWSSGRLLAYNRAELKTSDHRPVAALLDVQVLKTDKKSKEIVQDQVVKEEGPTDPTIIITALDSETLPEDYIDDILELFYEIGAVNLVRFVEKGIALTFAKGQSAVAAVQKYNDYQFKGLTLLVELKMPVWKSNVKNELKRDTVIESTFFSAVTNDLLGEEFKNRSLSFDVQDDDDSLEEDFDKLSLGDELAPPKQSPSGSGRSTPEKCFETAPKKVPPPSRPSKPPSRPPPPKKSAAPVVDLLSGSPPKSSHLSDSRSSNQVDLLTGELGQISSSSCMVIGKPELIAHSTTPLQMNTGKPKPISASSKRGSIIGKPTNVTHAGAKTEDDAKQLIENLMMGQSIESPELPAPLLPVGTKDLPRGDNGGVSAKPTPHSVSGQRLPSRPPLPKSASLPKFSNSNVTNSASYSSEESVTVGITGLALGSQERNRAPPPIPNRKPPEKSLSSSGLEQQSESCNGHKENKPEIRNIRVPPPIPARASDCPQVNNTPSHPDNPIPYSLHCPEDELKSKDSSQLESSPAAHVPAPKPRNPPTIPQRNLTKPQQPPAIPDRKLPPKNLSESNSQSDKPAPPPIPARQDKTMNY